jgi:NADPH-dependent 2,4-dienoyl-CoA reductase/sulfur reductase-like enzyme
LPYRQLGPAVSVAGRIATLMTAEAIIAGGDADLVSIGRAFHADPRWAAALLGDPGSPRPCIACNLCIDELGRGPIRCTVNPRAGRELEIAPDTPAPADHLPVADDKVLVVGAGPAGMEVARRLALGGRLVRLVERADRLGGQFALAAGLRCYPQYHRILDWYAAELARLEIIPELGVMVDEEWLLGEEPGTVVLATGGRGFMPEVAGIDLASVHDIRDWLRSAPHPDGGAFVVWGGDREGLAVADDLLARDAEVTLIIAGERFPRDAGRLAKALVAERLRADERCSVRFSSRVIAVTPEGVRLHGPAGEEELAGPITVLVSQGVEAETHLRGASRSLNPPGGVYQIGDAAGLGGSFADAIAGSVRLADNLKKALIADARA